MNQLYQMKGSFDNKNTWYQLEWFDVEFNDFEKISKDCNNISELVTEISKAFPKCQLRYKYLGERKKRY